MTRISVPVSAQRYSKELGSSTAAEVSMSRASMSTSSPGGTSTGRRSECWAGQRDRRDAGDRRDEAMTQTRHNSKLQPVLKFTANSPCQGSDHDPENGDSP